MSSQSIVFRPAVKYDAKGRVALIGPGGSGKSLTALKLGRLLAGPNGKIAAIDTEHGSLSKYADLFKFDVIELSSYSAENFLNSLHAAEAAGYAVFCVDSLSHFWMGKDGALEFVDEKKARARDQMEGWKEWRPREREMIDAMIASPCHIIATMRTKNEYLNEEYTDQTGKKKTRRIKVGLAPVQRDGLEYEFDLVGLMDDNNSMIIDKTRCSAYAGKVLKKPGDKEFAAFADWLKGEALPAPVAPPAPVAVAPAPAAGGGGRSNGVPHPPISMPPQAAAASASAPAAVQALWARMTNCATIHQVIVELRDGLLATIDMHGADEYDRILAHNGVTEPRAIRKFGVARAVVRELWAALQDAKALQAFAPADDDEIPMQPPATAAQEGRAA